MKCSNNAWACEHIKTKQRSTSKNALSRWALAWARGKVRWYWSADTLIWHLSIDHKMDLPYQVLKMWAASVASISWVYQYGRHVGCDSVVSTYAPATHIPLMKMIMRKSEQGFYFYRYGAPLGRSSAKKLAPLSQPITSKTKTNQKWPHRQSFWQDFDPERGYLSQFLLCVCRRHPRTPTPF